MIEESYRKNHNPLLVKDKLSNWRTMLSGAENSMKFSSFFPDANSLNNMQDLQNNAQFIANANARALQSFGAFSLASMGSVKTLTGGKKINGNGPSGGIIKKLISMVIGITEIPMRFAYMGIGLAEGAVALALSMEGLGQSFALAGEDLWYLIVAIAIVIWKYTLCAISFIITTVAGCFLVHVFTFSISVLFLIFPLTAYALELATGFDISPQIDDAFEKMHEFDRNMSTYTGMYLMQWPDSINLVCYSCFGMPVKLKDIITDVWSIKTAGDMISYDFSVRMPQYMKDAVPPATAADDAFNKVMG